MRTIFEDDFIVTHPRGRRELTPVTADSWWIELPRENFSAKAESLFAARRLPESMPGVTLQSAQRAGTL